MTDGVYILDGRRVVRFIEYLFMLFDLLMYSASLD